MNTLCKTKNESFTLIVLPLDNVQNSVDIVEVFESKSYMDLLYSLGHAQSIV